jgi:predicted RNase H-like HicB family nuclease
MLDVVTRDVHVPYTVEQDEDGVWCASALIRPGVGAVGDGATPEEAIADLRTAHEALLDVVGPPDELTRQPPRDAAPRWAYSPSSGARWPGRVQGHLAEHPVHHRYDSGRVSQASLISCRIVVFERGDELG